MLSPRGPWCSPTGAAAFRALLGWVDLQGLQDPLPCRLPAALTVQLEGARLRLHTVIPLLLLPATAPRKAFIGQGGNNLGAILQLCTPWWEGSITSCRLCAGPGWLQACHVKTHMCLQATHNNGLLLAQAGGPM